jgi:rubrerythrin
MDPIASVIVILSLALIAFISYWIYRKLRVARSHPPKSLTIQRSRAASDKPMTENKEAGVIGMIKCEYCGYLMLQTAVACPNCGAPRRK